MMVCNICTNHIGLSHLVQISFGIAKLSQVEKPFKTGKSFWNIVQKYPNIKILPSSLDMSTIYLGWVFHVIYFWVLCCLAVVTVLYIYSAQKTVDLLKRLLLGVVKTDSTWHCCILHFSASKMAAQCCCGTPRQGRADLGVMVIQF